MSAARPQTRDLLRAEQWPPDRFYWSIIDAPGRWKPGLLPPGLLAETAGDIPVDPDTLHVIGAPDGAGRIVVCAAPLDAIQQLASDVVSLTPAAAPPGVDIDPAALQFLAGRCEPTILRRCRARAHLRLAGTLLTCVLLIALGLARRANLAELQAAWYATQRASLLADIGLAEDQLGHEIAARQSLVDARDQSPVDVLHVLADMLAAWPISADASVESLTVAPDRILASISLSSDPAAFLGSFDLPAAWRMEEPRLNTARGLTRLGLQIRTEPSP